MAAPSVSLLSWLRPEQIDISFAACTWRLEAVTAADWLGALAMDFDGLSGVFPGLIGDDRLEEMLEILKDGAQEHSDTMQEVARKALAAAGGRDWWWTLNLARRVVGQWIYVNGFLVRQGVRADSTTLPDWLDACYTWLWERCDENQKTALDIELSIPPRGVRASRKQVEQMMAAFQAD